jgi:WD40 repeat protein
MSGRYVIVSGHADGILRIWNTTHGRVASLDVHGSRITAVAIGGILGRDVIISGALDGSIRVCDVAGEQLLSGLITEDDRQVTAVAAGQVNGRDIIISGGDDRKVRLWDIAAGTAEILHMLDSVTALAISPTHLAVASGIAITTFSLPHYKAPVTGTQCSKAL